MNYYESGKFLINYDNILEKGDIVIFLLADNEKYVALNSGAR